MAPATERWSVRRPMDRMRRNGGVGALTAVVMTVLVVLTYIVIVPVGGAVVGQKGSPSLWLSVLATALVALAFEPTRRVVYPFVAGLLGRERRDPYRILADFPSSVTGRYPAEELPISMAKALAEGTGAVQAEVWLQVQGELTRTARWPPAIPGNDYRDAASDGGTDERVRQQRSLDVRERGELLGRFTVLLHDGQQLTPIEERLFAGLAAQSGLVLRVTALRTDLRRQLDQLERRTADLRSARRDLVSRHDAERRRLERNIHDGAQQQVLALLVNLRLARTLVDRSSERAAAVLSDQGAAARAAVETLTALSSGLFPPMLIESGPVAALEAAVAAAPIPVKISAATDCRYPAALEAALYFSCMEAVQNATKHSGASLISVVITGDADALELTVSDDGRGFRPDRGVGSGLANIRDRIESVHGTVTVDSGPTGTVVRAVIPLRDAMTAGG